MHIGYGPITCQRHPGDRRTDAEIYQEAVTLAQEAEQLGFDSVWVAEHHFLDDGFLPSLLTMCAAMASCTSTIGIGAGTVLAPFYDPIVLAEEAAVVDLLSGGRLVLGLGQGWRPEEIEAFGRTKGQLPRELVRTIDVLRAAWAGGLVPADLVDVPVAVRPRPCRPGGPPIWVGAEVEAAIRRAGRIADGWQATMVDAERFGEQAAWALEERRAAHGGDVAGFAVGLHHATFTAPRDALETVRPWHEYFIWKSESMETMRGRVEAPEPPPATAAVDRAVTDRLICAGTPDDVIAQILQFQAGVEVPIHYVARMYFPGMAPAVQSASMALFAQEVMPALRAASPRGAR